MAYLRVSDHAESKYAIIFFAFPDLIRLVKQHLEPKTFFVSNKYDVIHSTHTCRHIMLCSIHEGGGPGPTINNRWVF